MTLMYMSYICRWQHTNMNQRHTIPHGSLTNANKGIYILKPSKYYKISNNYRARWVQIQAIYPYSVLSL